MDTETLEKAKSFDIKNTLEYLGKLSKFLQENVEEHEQGISMMFMSCSNAACAIVLACQTTLAIRKYSMKESKEFTINEITKMVDRIISDEEI